jgi:hypothetical protein
MFGLFDFYDIDLGNPELASGYSMSSSSNMLSTDSQVAQHSSTINVDTA